MIRVIILVAGILAILSSTAALADDKISDPAFLPAVRTIDRAAADVAAGRGGRGGSLRGPARTIGLEWVKIAPILSAGNDYIVEMQQVNRTVASFEQGWKTSSDPRDLANEITGAVADLYELTSDPKPPDVHRLAYLERKVAIAVDRQDWSAAGDAAGDLQSTWNGVKGDVSKQRGGPAAATSFDRASAKLLGAIKQRNGEAALAATQPVAAAVRSVGSTF